MQSSIYEAGEAARGLWEDIREIRVKSQSGQLDIAGTIRTVTQKVREKLEDSKADTDEVVLQKLQKTLLLASHSQEARTSVVGISAFLKDLGALGSRCDNDTPLMKAARSISAVVLQEMTRGPIDSCIVALQNWLSEKLIEAKILPDRYQKAIRKALEKTEGTVDVQSLVVNLTDLKETFKDFETTAPAEQHSVAHSILLGIDRFIQWLNRGIQLFDEAVAVEKEAREAAGRVEEALNKTGVLEQGGFDDGIIELQDLEDRAANLTKKKLLPQSVLDRIRIDWAYCLAKRGVEEKTVHRLATFVAHSLPKSLRKQVIEDQSLETLQQVREQIYHQSGFTRYQEAMRLLTRLTPLKEDDLRKAQSRLTEEQLSTIDDFFAWIIGNKRVNVYFHGKYPPTPLEEALSFFTYVTSEQNHEEAQAAIDKMQQILKASDIANLLKMRTTLQGFWQKNGEKYKGTLTETLLLLKKCKRIPEQDLIDQQFEALKLPSDMPEWDARFNDAHMEAVISLLGTLDRVSAMPVPVSKKRTEQQTITPAQKKNIILLKECLDEYRTALEDVRKSRTAIERQLGTARISPEELHTIEQYSRVAPLLTLLPSDTKGEEQNKLINSLREKSAQAERCISNLNDFMQLLPSYPPGTILFDDEVLTKGFKEGKEGADRAYSQMHIRSYKQMSQLVRDLIDKGPFAVQPYFTGRRTHASIITTHPNGTGSASTCKAEVSKGFLIEPVELTESLVEVAYEPNFEDMLTEEGKSRLGKNYLTKVRALYAQELSLFLNQHEAVFQQIQNDRIVAAQAFIKKRSPLVQKLINAFIPKQEEENVPKPLLTQKDETEAKELVNFQTRMFCSQLVTAITQAVLKRLDASLNEKNKSNIEYFKTEVQISPKEYETMDPDSLEKKIESYYSFIPPPAVVRYLMGKDYGKDLARRLWAAKS